MLKDKIFFSKYIREGEKEYHLSIGKYFHNCVYYDNRIWGIGFDIKLEVDNACELGFFIHFSIGPFGFSSRIGRFLQRYPFSQNVATAEIRVADCMFHRGNYEEARATYEEFRKRHPLHSEIPHSLLFEAKCYYEQRLAFTQDQKNLNEAQAKLLELIERYPSSAPAGEAKEILKDVRFQLCRREIHVGKFYLKKKEQYAAALRFEQAIALYGDSECYPEALFYAAKTWTALGEGSRAKIFVDTLLSEFPDTQWAKRAGSLAEEGSEK